TLVEGPISIDKIVGGHEGDEPQTVEVTREAVLEVLGSGLFTALAEQIFTFSHWSYAEFLTALYLDSRCPSWNFIKTIVCHPSDPGGRIIPQLGDTVAWLANMRSEVLKEVSKRDPQVLLRADLVGASSDA